MNQEKTPFAEGVDNKSNDLILDEFQGIESIYEFESTQCKDRFKLICLIIACKKVAEKNYLTLEQQMNIWIPKAWREE